jgi:peptidoglycan/LPS O-acetylase OafA/YrhL
MIVWLHVGGAMGIPRLNNFALGGGVSIFFVLSGFILTYRYPQLNSPKEIGLFLASRIARIWPAYAVGVFLELYIVWNTRLYKAEFIPHLAINLAMIQTWVPTTWFADSFNLPSWSVSTEYFFYLAFPFLIASFERTWWWKLALAALSAMVMVTIAMAIKAEYGTGTVPGILLMYEHPLARILEFVIGMCAALVYRRVAHMQFRSSMATIAEAAVVSILIATVYRWGTEYIDNHLGRWYYAGPDLALPAAAVIVVMALQRGAISRVLAARPLVFLGEISYSIFLIHYPIARLMGDAIKKYPESPPWAWGVGYVAIVLLASCAIYFIVERPMRRAIVWGARWVLERRKLQEA